MAMNDAQFIEKCIPDSLRLAKHQDAELVNSAIATALLAYRKALRDNVWEKNICSDVAMALSGFMEGTYTPHISQENEDWSKLQLEAEEARVMKASAAELAQANKPKPEPETVYYQVGRTSVWRVSKGYLTVEEINGNYVAKYETGDAEFTGTSPMAGDLNAARRSAADDAIRKAGFDPFATMPRDNAEWEVMPTAKLAAKPVEPIKEEEWGE